MAFRASTGQVLACVSDPAEQSFDGALQGAYPPGSTSKVPVSSALIAHGLSPTSSVSCPPSVTVDGEVFHNAEGDGPTQTLDGAFTESCNTSFIDLALSHLHPGDLPATAALFGLARTPRIGVPAFAANVTAPRGRTAMAAASIGQDTLTFSPLGMAMVAADVDRGSLVASRLIAGAEEDRIASQPLPTAMVDGLRTMMSHVPETGTAAGTGLSPDTFAKTGTAEYQREGRLETDAWLMGYRGDVAFAIVFQDSGDIDGGPRGRPTHRTLPGRLESLVVSGAWTRRFDRALGGRQDHRAELIALSDDQALQAAIVEALRALPLRFAISRSLITAGSLDGVPANFTDVRRRVVHGCP